MDGYLSTHLQEWSEYWKIGIFFCNIENIEKFSKIFREISGV